ncbi:MULTISPECIES: Lrp/AsnC family transcriptional regulator [Paenibacillus]|uniref:Lrp/AsnC family transcriptional regulator n=1 Tax=Paenibacillus TaxID=44249 RepID=UPI0022B8D4F3|nr:Lrp/AsnC family transcriptional regulator [Paenibacillus caseinilyticus]MCZ8521576.1 Lrp/AsnC family transcriptional regulator [Paenibacillus caseinilyticus]
MEDREWGRDKDGAGLDATDRHILRLLQTNSRLQWKEIGREVHLTGQAVGGRIRRMEDLGVIRGYTVTTDPERTGRSVTALVTVFLKSASHHSRFREFVRTEACIAEAHRISGDGCYQFKAQTGTQEELNDLLDRLLEYGNYRVQLSLGLIK